MARDLLIGIDAGTSVIKSVAFTAAGEQVGAAARPNVYRTVALAYRGGPRYPHLERVAGSDDVLGAIAKPLP